MCQLIFLKGQKHFYKEDLGIDGLLVVGNIHYGYLVVLVLILFTFWGFIKNVKYMQYK